MKARIWKMMADNSIAFEILLEQLKQWLCNVRRSVILHENDCILMHAIKVLERPYCTKDLCRIMLHRCVCIWIFHCLFLAILCIDKAIETELSFVCPEHFQGPSSFNYANARRKMFLTRRSTGSNS